MISGIPHASIFQPKPSLIEKGAAKPLEQKIAAKKEETLFVERGASSSTEKTGSSIHESPTTSLVRYGEAPSFVDRKIEQPTQASESRPYDASTLARQSLEVKSTQGLPRTNDLGSARSVPLNDQLKKEYIQKQTEETPIGSQFNAQA
ncbi:MAG: hypothetical protein V4507_13860 [Verrucomicrobiota bacterium]